MKKLPLDEAVGLRLGHDVTEIDPTRHVKHRAFARGHVIVAEDVEGLRDLGKNFVFVETEGDDEVHEDEAATTVAPLAAGANIDFDARPVEGKISFRAACDGVFRVDVERLYRVNALEIPSLPTIHDGLAVRKGAQVAAFRIIPLSCPQQVIEDLRGILAEPLLRVAPFTARRGGIVVTGSEVASGRIEDGFTDLLTAKLSAFGIPVVERRIIADDREAIAAAVAETVAAADIVFVTGGTSVDPDDVTIAAMGDAGVETTTSGNPLQPGNNFTMGTLGGAHVCAVPAAALFFAHTALDVFLPRMLAGEPVTGEEIFRAGHGGLCHFCPECHFPICPFGRGA